MFLCLLFLMETMVLIKKAYIALLKVFFDENPLYREGAVGLISANKIHIIISRELDSHFNILVE